MKVITKKKEAEIYEYDNENSSSQYYASSKNEHNEALDILSSMNSSNQQISDSIMKWPICQMLYEST